MSTRNIFIIEPSTLEESNAIKAFAKALKLKFKIAKTSESKSEILDSIQQGFKEVKLIEEGKLKSTNVEDFLNEL